MSIVPHHEGDLLLPEKPDHHVDVVCQEIVFPPAFIKAEREDLFSFHQLEVLDHSFRGEYQAFGYLGDKARFLPEQLDNATPVAVSEDIEESCDLNLIQH